MKINRSLLLIPALTLLAGVVPAMPPARADDSQKIDVKVGAPIITKSKLKHGKKQAGRRNDRKKAEKK